MAALKLAVRLLSHSSFVLSDAHCLVVLGRAKHLGPTVKQCRTWFRKLHDIPRQAKVHAQNLATFNRISTKINRYSESDAKFSLCHEIRKHKVSITNTG